MKVGEENFPNLSPEEIRKVLHELWTHQIELELQNEELRQAQVELVESRERLADLYDFAPVGYITASEKGIVLEANHTASEMLGLAKALLVGQPLSTLVAAEDQDKYYLHHRSLFEAEIKQSCDIRMLREDGNLFWAGMESIRLDDLDAGGCRLQVILSDISERKQAELKGEADRVRYTELVRHMSSGVAVYQARDNGQDFVFRDFNPAAERIDGIKRAELLGRSLLEVFPGVKDLGLFKVFQSVWQTGKAEHHPISFYKDDHLTGWRENYVFKLPSGEIVAVYDDATERKQAEEALSENAKKIELFAHSVVHDLKNPALAIVGLTKLLRKKYNDVLDEKGKTICDQILRSSDLISLLVDEINSYISAKESPLVIERVRLHEILGIVQDNITDQLNQRQIRFAVPDYLPEIMADRIAILRVIMNLLDNTLKYGSDTLSEIVFSYVDSDKFHILSVSDDGIGIPQQNSENIFGLFKRDHDGKDSKGVGLGLAIVKKIAERHGGKVWIEHGTLKGITFHVAISKSLHK